MKPARAFFVVAWLALLAGCGSFGERYVAGHPDLDSKTREAILRHEVILGMYPDEAIVAATMDNRPYASAVKSDPSYWPEGADSEQVIWHERIHPDDSQISLNFWNRAQFDTAEPTGFKVVFTHGRATSITRLPGPPKKRLSQEEATRIAEETAVQDGYRLKDYRKPKAYYGYSKDGMWEAFFECKAPTPANNFSIWINDQTGHTRVARWQQ